MNALSPKTLCEQPPGSRIERQLDLDIAIYRKVSAAPGRYSAVFGQHAILLSHAPMSGQVQLNRSKTVAGPTTHGTYSILEPNDQLTGVLEKGASYELILLCPTFVDNLFRAEFGQKRVFLVGALHVEPSPLVQSIARRFSALVEKESEVARTQARLCIELLVLKLVEGQVGTPNPADVGENLEAVARAVRFIDEGLAEQLDIKSIAQAAGLSPYYFSRIFRAAHQTSVHKFVLERRLVRARQLLAETDAPISTIALDTGFSSQSHLTTAFGQRFGITPSQYRSIGGAEERRQVEALAPGKSSA